MPALDDAALDQIFREGRTYNRFRDEPIDTARLRQAYDLAKMGPTSANCQPMRLVFVVSKEAKERLKPALSAGNRDKTMAAPATAIVAYDTRFYDELPRLFHDPDARNWFAGKAKHAETTAFRNGSLQGAYFILAARAVGLDCGPMSGFDNAKVDAAFFPDGRFRSNFLINLGVGDRSSLFPRNPRLAFDEACRIE
ncbi:MAG TPA: malonic semialdehyde reductase [Kiloniellales bacterium]|nr:malonic semialdehyde reductase [Kiloniellales bacterium]